MTISYTLDISSAGWAGVLKLLFRWRGSVWKAIVDQLAIWTIVYCAISAIYRYALPLEYQKAFELIIKYVDSDIDKAIPLQFMLAFFVSFVVSRWMKYLKNMGWIDDTAMAISTFIRGYDEKTRIARRNLIRYMVLSQTLVLRDTSLQVRKRFPSFDTLVASGADTFVNGLFNTQRPLVVREQRNSVRNEETIERGLMTEEEKVMLNNVKDNKYWLPIQWASNILYECKNQGVLEFRTMMNIFKEVDRFREGLEWILKYDWVPIPLVYPQLIFLAVRIHFMCCLIGRQFIIQHNSEPKKEADPYLPVMTMIQFLMYVGWMKVAEAMMNPLGEDDDDLECNYIIDKNLISGLELVDAPWLGEPLANDNAAGRPTHETAVAKLPPQQKDLYWDLDKVTPLYTMEMAGRTVEPLIGSASHLNMVEKEDEVLMIPHKNDLIELEESEQILRRVNVEDHNKRFNNKIIHEKLHSADKSLKRFEKFSKSLTKRSDQRSDA